MSGQTQGVKSPPLRGYRRRKTVLDLNVPPIEGRDDEGTSTTRIEPPEGVQASHQRNGQGPSLPPPTIDVDAIDDDDDVIESSPRAFAQGDSLTISVEGFRRIKRSSIVIFISTWKAEVAAVALRGRTCRPCRQRSQPSTARFACVHWSRRCQQNADTFSVRLAYQTQSKDRPNALLVGKESLLKSLLECSSQQPVDFDAHIQLLFMVKSKERWNNGYSLSVDPNFSHEGIYQTYCAAQN
ncbi:PREDICTED: uncharacterized protein LOC105125750 isoform X1 [Populus euphratica]|uniref:Uncharacterized protein LOC105125750 isoform X1 n=1 Tax=Populus euphratica TaxID=75702 RepID=A0AAJ6U7L7_POPEU|nr:PREDICTED: uncharacterized protein LOC105125750 isoform X1 [Populus euphratica]